MQKTSKIIFKFLKNYLKINSYIIFITKNYCELKTNDLSLLIIIKIENLDVKILKEIFIY